MRKALKVDFLRKNKLEQAQRIELRKDASHRQYERIIKDDGSSLIFMDAPPDKEEVKPFIKVANFLIKNNLSAPEVIISDIDDGFLLLEDFGDDSYTKVLSGKSQFSNEIDETMIYEKAVDSLVHLHKIPYDKGVFESYDETMLVKEAMRFIEFYLETLNGEMVSKNLIEEFVIIWKHLLSLAKVFAEVVVLKDYHADNLMWLDERRGVRKVGILDFQDAVIGSPLYDLVSLLEDARRDVSPELAENMIRRYLQVFPNYPRKEFMAAYAIFGAQRNLKIIGFCAAQATKNKNPYYLTLLPRVWKYLNQDLRHPLLLPLKKWLHKMVPMQMKY